MRLDETHVWHMGTDGIPPRGPLYSIGSWKERNVHITLFQRQGDRELFMKRSWKDKTGPKVAWGLFVPEEGV